MNQNTLTLNNKQYKAEHTRKNALTVGGMSYGLCSGCAFENDSVLCSLSAKHHSCIASEQSDYIDIIWIEQK